MLTDTRIQEELKPVDGLDWITALRGSTLKQFVESGDLQLSLKNLTFIENSIVMLAVTEQ